MDNFAGAVTKSSSTSCRICGCTILTDLGVKMHQEYHRFDSNLPKLEKVSECHFPCYSRDSMFLFTTFQMDDLESINELKDFLDYRPKSQDDIMECLSGELGAHSPNEILLSEANGIGGQEVSSFASTDSMTFVETIFIFDIFRTVFFRFKNNNIEELHEHGHQYKNTMDCTPQTNILRTDNIKSEQNDITISSDDESMVGMSELLFIVTKN